MKYQIINANNIADLITKVNEELEDDWELQWGVCVMPLAWSGIKACYQAMCSEEEVEEQYCWHCWATLTWSSCNSCWHYNSNYNYNR